ncbi:MAG: ExbD/TolR family protein [Sphingomicrobium sp.]
MRIALDLREPSPIAEMNTTPLIDVLLVLLVMFIITIPLQTHAVKLDLPGAAPTSDKWVSPVRNEIEITAAGAILWNGQSVTRPELSGLLARSQSLRPAPELHLRPEANARYAVVDEVLAMTKRARVQNMGFVGNDAYADF